jgi:hypothetical protein
VGDSAVVGFLVGQGGVMPEYKVSLWDEVSLWVEFPTTGQWATIEELRSRHQLENLLDELLYRHQLGEWSGGGQGFGKLDMSFAVPRDRWETAWELVRSKLAELALLGRAEVKVFLDDEGLPRKLWPPSSEQGAAQQT